jgi:hypothetical protein
MVASNRTEFLSQEGETTFDAVCIDRSSEGIDEAIIRIDMGLRTTLQSSRNLIFFSPKNIFIFFWLPHEDKIQGCCKHSRSK